MATLQSSQLEDDAKERVSLLIRHRVPWLFVGLTGGMIAAIFASQFEKVLLQNLDLAYFIPVIVYMADAVGHQTEEVYIRNLGKERISFVKYLFKELLLGLFLGLIFGICLGVFALIWFKSFPISLTVGLAMFISMAIAPAVSLIMPTILQKEHKDPAVGSGPFTTAIQDLISLLIYFSIASVIIFKA
ncbi:MAG: magnesium transporter [Candidatus Levybacteria bacterium]|nr:magnesium transporter [Candidatus Levybacteria bacterium]